MRHLELIQEPCHAETIRPTSALHADFAKRLRILPLASTEEQRLSNNYPPGVSGSEYEVSGPDSEYTDVRTSSCQNEACKDFGVEDVELEVDIQSYRFQEWYEWACPTCGDKHEVEGRIDE
jgi:hypothetical protein